MLARCENCTELQNDTGGIGMDTWLENWVDEMMQNWAEEVIA